MDAVVYFWNRTVSNLVATFTDITPQKFVRIAIILGVYAVIRRFLSKAVDRSQMDQHETPHDAMAASARPQISPNSLRGQIDIPEDSDDEENEVAAGTATASDWGKKARRRQREVMRKLLDAEEKRLAQQQEDDEDKDIEEFLEKE